MASNAITNDPALDQQEEAWPEHRCDWRSRSVQSFTDCNCEMCRRLVDEMAATCTPDAVYDWLCNKLISKINTLIEQEKETTNAYAKC